MLGQPRLLGGGGGVAGGAERKRRSLSGGNAHGHTLDLDVEGIEHEQGCDVEIAGDADAGGTGIDCAMWRHQTDIALAWILAGNAQQRADAGAGDEPRRIDLAEAVDIADQPQRRERSRVRLRRMDALESSELVAATLDCPCSRPATELLS